MTSPTAPVVSATGIAAPTYAQIYAYLIAQYQSIFGADSYLGNDSQDGQLLAVFAQAISDANSAAVAVYNAFSPTTAQGAGLSSVVAINGLQRLVPTNSSVVLTIAGSAGAIITNGVAGDASGNSWALPTTTTIGAAGTVTVTAVCTVAGTVNAPSGTVTQILTPTFGWATVTNPAGSTNGAPVETDAALRVRQAGSVALPSVTVFEGVVASIEDVPGTTRVNGVENNTASTGGSVTAYPFNVPARSTCFIIESSAAQSALFGAIFSKMPPGIPTYGIPVATFTGTISGSSLTVTGVSGTIAIGHYIQYAGMALALQVTGGSGGSWTITPGATAIGPIAMTSGTFVVDVATDANASERLLVYNPAQEVLLNINLTGVTLAGWVPATVAVIEAQIASYLASLPIGANISYFGLIPFISLVDTPYFGTFEITAMSLALDPAGIGFTAGAGFTASTSGTTLTTSATTGTIAIGQQLWYPGIATNVIITILSGSGTSWVLSSAPSPALAGTLCTSTTTVTVDIPLNFNYAVTVGYVAVI